ncbi:hypothetical protein Amsp01_091030 [Amycolatopsis sp. NBRC 101858]|uniref:serine/threonine-protein kinase n=1 Tax=Amycolatopsis sp. NBRC 101858 TaxID=3032200 RepID=UPI0024A51BF4|nr:serine/threonine-protein kinase [Amycolatopsis sp. NBRC 101858]GLY43080.1 hypothetical protein Amsp01_091030 [Amycolatopsis sp. NBRC 101858]
MLPGSPDRQPWWARDEPPDVIAGRYEIGGLIGTGGTARVYQAFDRLLSRDVAVKVYERGTVAVEGLRRLREKAIQASIDHPGVVAVYDSGTDGDWPFLVMRLVTGENLAQRLLAGPMPAGQVTEVAAELAGALACIHDRRIVHRDLKPANILLDGDGPLISDFGIAHELGSTHVTGTGLVTGTAAYLAPEQVEGEEATPAADVYALGLIVLECMTAEREYPGTLAESATARLRRPPRIPDGLPGWLAQVLERMTAREPGQRPTAGEVARLLREPPETVVTPAPAGGGLAVTAAETVVTPAPPERELAAPGPHGRSLAAARGLAAAVMATARAGRRGQPVGDLAATAVVPAATPSRGRKPPAPRRRKLVAATVMATARARRRGQPVGDLAATAVVPAATPLPGRKPPAPRRRKLVAAGGLATAAAAVVLGVLLTQPDTTAPAGSGEPVAGSVAPNSPSPVPASPSAAAVLVGSRQEAPPVAAIPRPQPVPSDAVRGPAADLEKPADKAIDKAIDKAKGKPRENGPGKGKGPGGP